MKEEKNKRRRAILVGLGVTFIWATSWIITPIVIKELPPITYAGIRFFLAGLVLLGVHFLSKQSTPFKSIEKKDWQLIVLLAITQTSFMQFTQYIALTYLDSTTLNLVSNLGAIVIMGLSVMILKEKPTRLQFVGAGLFFVGLVAYYYPFNDMRGEWQGYFWGFIFIISLSFASIISRALGRRGTVKAVTYTSVSMLMGGVLNLMLGLIVDGPQTLSLKIWGMVIYMAIVNAALAFTLWNWTFTLLASFETALISSTMLIEIAFLEWVIYGRTFGPFELLGLGLVMLAVVLVQMKKINLAKFKKSVE